jgi:hypothetical protein
MNNPDEKFGRQTKKLFDQSVDGLDASTLSRLNRSRQLALAEPQQAHTVLRRWAPVTGIAAAEILLGEDSFDMLEDLEFYSWLDTVEAEDGGDVS